MEHEKEVLFMTEVNGQDKKLIIFRIEEEEYAVSIQNVGSIEKIEAITRVPGAADFVKGVINLRGVITPVIDLKQRFHQRETIFTEQSRIIIIHVDDITVGFIVDEANDVIDVNDELIEEAPEVVGSHNIEYISGVVKLDNRLLILLELTEVLQKQELTELRNMEG